MILNQSFTVRDRKQAGLLLAEKLTHLRNSTAVIVGVPYSGAVLGYHVAENLGLPFDVISCKAINHPADQRKTIGSVSAGHVVMHDEGYDIPRDYIYHQIVVNQSALKAKQSFYNPEGKNQFDLYNKEVVLVGDVIKSADSIVAAIKTINSMKAARIVVAASFITPDAFRQLSAEVDEIVSLSIENELRARGFYEENSIVRDEDIRGLVLRSCSN